jgi:hypothetical protein
MGGENMVMMYGMPPDMSSPRFKPIKPMEPGKEGIGPVTQPMPGVQAMPPVTHNPFTGEPVNLLEVLAENAFLKDEKKRLERVAAVMDRKIVVLEQQAGVDRSSITTLESKYIDLETRYNALARLKNRPELKPKAKKDSLKKRARTL